MKHFIIPILAILLILGAVIYGAILYSMGYNDASDKIDLPEEYMLITKDTPIQGYFTKDSVLHIEFKHTYKQIGHSTMIIPGMP